MDPTQPTIVDCDLLEAAKENVQPLANGRRVTALSSVLSTPHALRDGTLSRERARWRAAVCRALDGAENGDEEGGEEGKDPLETYNAFVTWTLEHYPQGHSAESGLLELLEEATRVLKDHNDGKYKNELKYLKLWILYANFVEKPTVVYRFLMANDIGQDWAAFYEEFAMVLERDGRHKQADAIYQLGIARKATPLDRLRNRYREFQKRMMSSTSTPPSTSPPPTVSSGTGMGKKRTVLGTTSSSTTTPASTRPSQPRRNAPIQVFQDSPSPTTEIPTNAFPDIGTRATRTKENTREVSKMAGTVMKAKGVASRAAACGGGISVYRDPEDGAGRSVDVFRDEEPKRSAGQGKTEGKLVAKLPAESRSKLKGKSPSISSIAVFRDEEEGKTTGSTDGEEAGSRKTRVGFTPFRDEGATLRMASGFVPFRDEVTTTGSGKERERTKGVMGQLHSFAEAEVLRKDPLRNYPDGGGLGEDEDWW